MSRRLPELRATALRWALVAFTAAVALFPFLWMLRTSLAPPDEVYANGLDLLPGALTLGNYTEAWRDAGLGSAMLNGAIVVAAIVALQIVTCVPAAYTFAKLRFRGRDLLYGSALIALLIPIQAVAIPTFLALSELDLVNTRLSLILPFASSAFGIFLIRQYMVTIPDALLEAARMDGLGHARTLLRIVVPISRPAIYTFALFSIFVHWNDYLWPLLVARDPGLRTPPLALAFFQQEAVASGVDFGALTAGAAIVTAPIVALFVLTRRRFVAGISGGEVVG